MAIIILSNIMDTFNALMENNTSIQTIAFILFSIYILNTYFFNSSKSIYVSELYIYPIKGCGGIRMEKISMCSTGFKHDRRWLIVNSKGKFITQREKPELCNILPIVKDDGTLILRGPNMWDLAVPTINAKTKFIDVTIWDDTVYNCPDQGDEASDWINDYLDTDGYRLVWMDTPLNTIRHAPKKHSKHNALNGKLPFISFADAFNYLILGRESLNDLNYKLAKKRAPTLEMNRFRPNIVTIGGKPYEEDTYNHIKIGTYNFIGVKHCTRCIVTTTNQLTAEQTGIKGEPLKTFRTYRRDPNQNDKIVFGENLSSLLPTYNDLSKLHKFSGVIRVGDKIDVITRKHRGF